MHFPCQSVLPCINPITLQLSHLCHPWIIYFLLAAALVCFLNAKQKIVLLSSFLSKYSKNQNLPLLLGWQQCFTSHETIWAPINHKKSSGLHSLPTYKSPSRRHGPGCCLTGLFGGIPDSQTEAGVGGMLFSISLPTSGQFCVSNKREKGKGSSFFSVLSKCSALSAWAVPSVTLVIT